MKKILIISIMVFMIASALPIGLISDQDFEENIVFENQSNINQNGMEKEYTENEIQFSESIEQEDSKIYEKNNEKFESDNNENINYIEEKEDIKIVYDEDYKDDTELSYLLDHTVAAIKARESTEYSPYSVWEMGYKGDGINIAIMDSGVDDAIGEGHSSVDDMDDDETTYDPKFIAGGDGMSGAFIGGSAPIFNPEGTDEGHGTHVAGIALATGTTHQGVAPEARLIDMRVGALTNLNINGVINGIQWAIDNNETDWENDGPRNNGVPILSMSFGGGTTDGTDNLALIVNDAVEAGIVMVAAAGNGGSINTPSTADRAICIANVNDHDTVDRDDDTWNSASSSTGPRPDDGDDDEFDEMKPDVSAPGTDIVAPVAHTKVLLAAATGTSMSTPHVAGVVALMLQANPDLRPKAPQYEYPIKRIMRDTAQDDPDGRTDNPTLSEKWDIRHGWGFIDAWACVQRALDIKSGIASGPSEANSKQTVTFNARMNFTRTEYTIEDDEVKFKVIVPGEFEKPNNIRFTSTGDVGYSSGFTDPQKNNDNDWEFNGWIRFTEDLNADEVEFCLPKILFDAVAPEEKISDRNYDIVVQFYLNDIIANKDSHTIRIKKATKPDLTIEDILFTPDEPKEGDLVEIRARIEDTGGISSTTEISFYDGDPDLDGKKIGTTKVISVPAGGSNSASVNWDTTDDGGGHTIYIIIENTVPEESDITNNKDYEDIYVNQPPTVDVENPNGGEIWAGEQDITWIAEDPDNDDLSIDILYSDDAGNSWSQIKIGEENEESYTWDTKTVSNDDDYLIKIRATDSHFSVEDTSNGLFEIRNEEPGNNPPEITVISPNGGENWEGTNDILWNAEDEDGDILKITIEYITKGEGTKIAEDMDNTGTYSWDTNGLTDRDDYLIKISANDGKTTTKDESNGFFTLYNPIAPVVTNIYYPTEGEVLDESVNIEWRATDENKEGSEDDELLISIDYWNGKESKWKNIVEGLPNTDKKYPWDTTVVEDRNDYKIRVTATDPRDLTHSLETEGTFRVWNDDLSLTLYSPEPGNEYSEEGVNIEWSASDRDESELTIRIEYSDDGGDTWSLIVDDLIDTYLFFIDSSHEDDLDDEEISTQIEKAFEDYDYFLSNKAEAIRLGEGRWKITDKSDIYIIKKENEDLNIYRPITEYNNWRTDDLEDGENYLIKITAYNNTLGKTITVEMDGDFSINNPENPVIEILAPSSEGESWNGIEQIRWIASDPDGDEIIILIGLYIYESETDTKPELEIISLDEENDGSYSWDTTELQDWDYYKILIQVVDETDRMAQFISPMFKINNPEAPYVQLKSPNGGENWSWEEEIKWVATDPDGDELKIEIYLLDGSKETKITTTDNTGSYTWNTSVVGDGNDYKIKIIAIETSEFSLSSSDESNDTFEIYNGGKYGIELEINSLEMLIGKTGDTLEYELLLTNLGEMKDTFKIEPSKLAGDWIIALEAVDLDNGKISLPGGLWQKIKLLVTIPEGEDAGISYEIKISGTSIKSGKTSNVSVFVEIERIYGVRLDIDIKEKEVLLGTDVFFNLTITNNGNDKDSFTLTHSLLNTGWDAKFDMNDIEITPGNSKLVILTITSPEKVDNLTEDGKLELEITVTTSNPDKKTSTTIIVNGVEPEKKDKDEGFIPGFELIVLLAGICIALGFVFIRTKRY